MEDTQTRDLIRKAHELILEIRTQNCALPVSVHDKLAALSAVVVPLLPGVMDKKVMPG